jgi:hypothetical protein
VACTAGGHGQHQHGAPDDFVLMGTHVRTSFVDWDCSDQDDNDMALSIKSNKLQLS